MSVHAFQCNRTHFSVHEVKCIYFKALFFLSFIFHIPYYNLQGMNPSESFTITYWFPHLEITPLPIKTCHIMELGSVFVRKRGALPFYQTSSTSSSSLNSSMGSSRIIFSLAISLSKNMSIVQSRKILTFLSILGIFER